MLKTFKSLPLHIKIIIGLALGTIWAFVSSYAGLSEFTMNWIAPWGDIFINLLKLIAVPLVLFSIIQGITGLSDTTSLGRMGLKTIGLYLLTTMSAIAVGLLIVNTVKPGTFLDEEQRIVNRLSYEMWAVDNDVAIKDGKSFLTNPEYEEYADAARSKNQDDTKNSDLDISNKLETAKETQGQGPLQFVVDMVPSNIFLSFNNSLMLQVIFFAIFFGLTVVSLPREKVETVISFVDGSSEVFIKMVDIVMKGAPFFVFALLAGKLSELAGNNPSRVLEIFKSLGWYSLAVVGGLAFMAFVLYPFIMIVLVKKLSYKTFFRAISPAQFLAFSSSSSAAPLPVTMECVHENLKVREEVSSFVLPIGATVNMDGTSLYQAVAVIFLAQFHFVDLDFVQQLTIILTATLASIGSAAVPSAGLIMLIIVLESVGLNPAWIAIIFPVDRILDMCRTVVNVTGDATVTSIVAASEGKLDYNESTNSTPS
jgi:Na+/H+-dicarboxylate symporter